MSLSARAASAIARTARGALAACRPGGCGFHLQGSAPLPRSLALVRIDAIDTQSDFYFGLRKALLAAGTRIDEDGHDPSATVIHVLTDARRSAS